jgi:hypothetical protein
MRLLPAEQLHTCKTLLLNSVHPKLCTLLCTRVTSTFISLECSLLLAARTCIKCIMRMHCNLHIFWKLNKLR